MIQLVLAILCSSLVALGMRWAERHGKGRLSMLLVNYLVCTALSACFTGGVWMPRGVTLGMGMINGFLFLAGFVMYLRCVGHSGVILASTFMKLGVLVPTLLSILVFGESPRVTQILGILLTVAAIILMNVSKEQGKIVGLGGLLLLMFGGGMTDSMAKIYDALGQPEQQGIYLLITFVMATILCLALVIVRKAPFTKHDVLDGVLLAIPNFFSARFLLQSLANVPAVVAYPTYSVASIALVSLFGVVVFRERLSRNQWMAMGVIGAALVLLNV